MAVESGVKVLLSLYHETCKNDQCDVCSDTAGQCHSLTPTPTTAQRTVRTTTSSESTDKDTIKKFCTLYLGISQWQATRSLCRT